MGTTFIAASRRTLPALGERGLTLVELLGALAVAALLTMGLASMIDTSLDDMKGQQAGLHQEQVTAAARRYISANYDSLLTATAAGAVSTITVGQLQAAGFLPASFSSTNTFGQTPCVLVRQPASGKLDALVAAAGGRAIPERDLRLAAMHAGQGGGYISTSAPGTARGASWELATTSYRNISCDGTVVLTGTAASDGGHLVSALFYDGPGQLPTDYLYRDEVPGRPELNRMNTTIHMMPGTDAQAVEGDASDPRCTVASGTGKIAVSATGQVLSCQSGVWRRQGSGFWRDPVARYADLPLTANNIGDVRLETESGRAYTWTGAGWKALAIDQNGNFTVPGTMTANVVKLGQTVVKNASCSENGMIARDADGLLLSCKSGIWRSPLGVRLSNLVYTSGWELYGNDTARSVTVNLSALSGSRPLYLTGYSTCHATGTAPAQVSVDMLDASGASIAYAGGCLSQLGASGVGVQNLGDIGLQKIPENVTRLQLYLEPGNTVQDYVTFVLMIYSD